MMPFPLGWLFRRGPEPPAEPLAGPLRGELLGAEHLAERVRAMARAQQVRPATRPRRTAPLLNRLTETRRILGDVQERLSARSADDAYIGPAGEWLLDNFHVIREHIREVHQNLPRDYYEELPELASGLLAGYPRVYELAITLISHSESRVDLDNVTRFIDTFQEVQTLAIGELWALPAMLRLGLIESVRRMALRTVQRLDQVDSADAWAARIEAASAAGDSELSDVLRAFARDHPPFTAIFVSRFLQQIHLTAGQHPPLAALEHWITEEGMSAEHAAAMSTQRLALTQIVMAHSITSLRAIAGMDWKQVVERHSAMDVVLREDPSGHYRAMTFASRDRYRHVVEKIARRAGGSEVEVAQAAIGLARAAATDTARGEVEHHVGYYLVDDGVEALERVTSYRPAPGEAVHRWLTSNPTLVLGGGIVTAAIAVLGAVMWLAGAEARTAWPLVLLVVFVPAADIAVNVVNQLLTAFLPPRTLPALDVHGPGGVPPALRTAVVTPTLFGSVEEVEEALENLEVQYLANRAQHVHFAILSDFMDAATATVPGDTDILAAAVAGMRALNERYAPRTEDAFYLFHRPRRWNPQQGVWMGWERKRGKLAEFNRFLRGGDASAFSEIVGNRMPLANVRYVITLDADTALPPNAAAALIGTMAHPLNRAVYSGAHGRIVRGYGILQPRVGISLPSAHRSRFAAIHSGHPGVDPYTTAVSDLYQDLFGEGSFTGKGIYDVAAFEQATHGRFPENTLLSHDLIEGSYARAGLVTNISVYDDYPQRYLTFTRRKHRWIRGDWQLLRWLTAYVPGPGGWERNRLPMLSRWKIIDNLRRSTVEVGALVMLVAGWTVLPGSPLTWTLLSVGAIAMPWLLALLLAAVRPPLDRSWRAYYGPLGADVVTSAKQLAVAIVFLPHQAWISADAIVRTLWRLFVSRRRLLEWQTASHAERSQAGGAWALWRQMMPAVLLALGILALVGLTQWLAHGSTAAGTAMTGLTPRSWQLFALVVPFVTAWVASPAVAHLLGAPALRQDPPLSAEDQRTARRYALLHWRYFDRFVTAATNWLAPDNFQEDPAPVVAERTSPTNIGLQLLSTVSAYDLGFITAGDMVNRLELAFASMERMRRLRGHFFNWYELRNLEVLEPAYISTVDSGNLAGHLIALRQACLDIAEQGDHTRRLPMGLHTGLDLAAVRLRSLVVGGPGSPVLHDGAAAAAEKHLERARTSPAAGQAAGTFDVGAVVAQLEAARAALEVAGHRGQEDPALEWIDWSIALAGEIRDSSEAATQAAELRPRLEDLAARSYRLAMGMDFTLLLDPEREVFAIGYQTARRALDNSYYDLLASEARLASFVAIAKNDAPVAHWFRLGRTLTRAAGETALVSWSGSMFEYLMPALVMRSYPNTVLDQTSRGAVRRQVAYGALHGVPWGVSESAYNLRDHELTYQYRAFGVPDLGLKRGLGHDLVVAPYASLLAALVEPRRALTNLAALERKGALGPFGFRDAIDYTRPEPRQRYAIVGNYMAHHVGMSVVALANVLCGQIWQQRFHADALVRSVELLLHERIPRRLLLQGPQEARPDEALPDPDLEAPVVREFTSPDLGAPHIALLGRQPYTLMLSHAGAGYSRYEDVAVTRWRADATADATGQFIYVRDLDAGRTWSASHQPVGVRADWYRAMLATDRVTFHRADGDIETLTEIAVVPEDAAEVRRVTVFNNGSDERVVELTSYGEVVLGPPDADRAHPAFGNLFVETEWHDWCSAITATRRPRSNQERELWCVHVVDAGRDRVGGVSCETDRARFLGRGGTTRRPAATSADGDLSGTTGAVLDPIFAIRVRLRLGPGQSASAAFTTLVATSRESAFELADRYHDTHAAQRALDLAWTAQQVELRELGVTPADVAVFQEIAGFLLYPHPALRAPADVLLSNRGSQQVLWAHGISGDWPILLATIAAPAGLPTLRHVFAAHRYMRRRGMKVDLVVLTEQDSSLYMQELHERVMEALFASGDEGMDQPGGVFIRRPELLGDEALLMLRATARVHVNCDGRSLGRIVDAVTGAASTSMPGTSPAPDWTAPGAAADAHAARVVRRHEEKNAPATVQIAAATATNAVASTAADSAAPGTAGTAATADAADPARLALYNGIGGLTPAGDYLMDVRGDALPPAPWANVIANPRGGFIVTERGAGCTWAGNSYFFRLTPWYNDPVSDPAGEAIYLRDEESGAVWRPTPGDSSDEGHYAVRHAPGTSVFEHERAGIATELTLGLACEEALKFSLLRVTNRSARPRRIALTAFVEWTLGVTREHTRHQVRTAWDQELGAMLAGNDFDPQFAGWTALLALSEPVSSHTGDRREFLGRNGDVDDPAGVRSPRLAGTTGVGHDPCGALRCSLELQPGETRDVVVLLGAAEGADAARALVRRFGSAAEAAAEVGRSVAAWEARLSVITVRTPEPTFDAMVNRWTLYQALACRMWARSAVYQSSGAFGFRDQLQDVMAFVYAEPALAREHILRAAARQFVEGDVQHWWHPQSGRGVRTRFSDDLAWLPCVTDHYVRVTGDAGVLDERVPFLEMRPLEPDEHEVYDLPRVADEEASVYEHCLRALRRACTTGEHGLPLIGSGDWNDGMNRVGADGRGESVWLGWFLVATLRAFSEHVEERGDTGTAAGLRAQADAYVAAIEEHGWDGEWYRRAFFDDGTPLGTAASDECSIDSIAQSWSVISGAGAPDRQARAMHSLDEHLVRDDAGIIVLLTPPFDTTPHDPGYIKGYLPGVRENGAQYTHAALWVVLAHSLLGDGERALDLFQMINPLEHTATPEGVATYKVEPYVVAADVYTADGQLGRGGWTWYTGSASWMYRVALEAILGFHKRGDVLRIQPRVPAAWPELAIEYRFGGSLYRIVVRTPGLVRPREAHVTLDGERVDGDAIPLRDDGRTHDVLVLPADHPAGAGGAVAGGGTG
ncbi:MAG TPA: glucoamylase family protein [Longimicrobiales bacterium]|nr:glucoamylase family protein [Longimicrobiales bacterium]